MNNEKEEKDFATVRWLLILTGIVLWYIFQGSFSPFIGHTSPILGDPGKPVYGYSYYYGDDLYHKENFYPLKQLETIKSGSPGKPGAKRSFTDRRIFYPTFVQPLTILFSPVYAFQIFNLLLLGISSILIYKLCSLLLLPRAFCYTGVFLNLFSPATITFIGDNSPHLLGNTFYFLWGYLLFLFRNEKISWKKNLGLSALLCLWLTSYPSAGYAGLAYILYLLFKRLWLHAALPLGAILLMPKSQLFLLTLFGIRYGANTEALYFIEGIQEQLAYLQADPLAHCTAILQAILDFLFIDHALIMVFAILGLILHHQPAILLLTFIPIAVVLPVFTTSSARAYIVSGIGICIYPSAAYGLYAFYRAIQDQQNFMSLKKLLSLKSIFFISTVAAITFFYFMASPLISVVVFLGILSLFLLSLFRSRYQYTCGVIAISTLLLFQVYWSVGPYFQFPLSSFALTKGFFKTVGRGSFMTKQPSIFFQGKFLRYTGEQEQTPSSLGGTITWKEAIQPEEDKKALTLLTQKRADKTLEKQSHSLLLTSLFLFFSVVALVALLPTYVSIPTTIVFLAIMISSFWLGSDKGFDKKQARYPDQHITLYGEERLNGEIKISQDFRAVLEKELNKDSAGQIELYINLTKKKRGHPIFKVWDDGFRKRPENTMENNLVLTPDSFLKLLDEHNNTISFEVYFKGDPSGKIYVGSWQKSSLFKDSRSVMKTTIDGETKELEWFPNFEIRIRHKDGYFTHIGV